MRLDAFQSIRSSRRWVASFCVSLANKAGVERFRADSAGTTAAPAVADAPSLNEETADRRARRPGLDQRRRRRREPDQATAQCAERGAARRGDGDPARRARRTGYSRCEDIMRLETVLAGPETDSDTYDPGNYAVVAFGHSGSGDPWGRRIEGHHLSLNFTHAPEGVTVTPAFFGAHPATVEHGPLKDLRVLGSEEDLGRQLIRRLDDALRHRALIRVRAFDDILTGPGRETSLRRPVGVALGEIADEHRNLMMLILDRFLGAMQPAIAEAERRRVREGGLDRLHFGWAGGIEPRQPHHYRLHGPTLVLEYDNTQNDANHIHSVWHDPQREFGADLLRRHYEHASHAGHSAGGR
jgi:Protein of unknown function (DUF3500)